MGVGYDTVTAAMYGQLGMGLLLGILVAKLLATTMAIGLGIPGGLIAPTLIIGGVAGAVLGITGAQFLPHAAGSIGLYVMIGMSAMMAATLQAPLAALMALLELTANPNIILPGMLAVIAATLTCSEIFGRQSIFIMLLRTRGLDYRHNPFVQNLHRIGIASMLNRDFVRRSQLISLEDAKVLADTENLRWIIVEDENRPVALLPLIDLQQTVANWQEEDDVGNTEITGAIVDLAAIPAQRLQLAGVHLQATLQEGIEQLDAEQADALYVWRPNTPQILRIEGVVTRDAIDKAWHGVSM